MRVSPVPSAGRRSCRADRGIQTGRPTGARRASDNVAEEDLITMSATRSPALVATIELLRKVPIFADLDDADLEKVSSVAIPRSFPRGVRVFHEGDLSDACYIVRDGDLRVTREHSDGRAIALATLAR